MYISHRTAATLLRRGYLVGVPTETVYGLAGRADKAATVRRIFKAKNRPPNRPLIVHYSYSSRLWLRDCLWNEDAHKLASKFWPGPLTLILPATPSPIAREVSGFTTSLAIRCSAHEVMDRLCAELGPLAAPSINKYQMLSATTDLNAALINSGTNSGLGKIPILRGEASYFGLESTILDLTTPKPYVVRRLGIVQLSELQTIVECKIAEEDGIMPGSGPHYKPSKPIRINVTTPEAGEAFLGFGPSIAKFPSTKNLSPTGNLQEAAQNLYRMLQELSETNCSRIAVAPIPMHGLGLVINDKLERAILPL